MNSVAPRRFRHERPRPPFGGRRFRRVRRAARLLGAIDDIDDTEVALADAQRIASLWPAAFLETHGGSVTVAFCVTNGSAHARSGS